MAKIIMKSVAVYALRSERKKILERLQRLGCVDISRSSESEPEKGFIRISTESQAQSFDRNAAIADQAISIINGYVPEGGGLLSSFSGRKIITDEQYAEGVKVSLSVMDKCHTVVADAKEIAEGSAERVRTAAQIATLEPWRNLDVSEQFPGTLKTTAFIGVLPKEWNEEELCEALAEKAPDILFTVDIVNSSAEQTCVFILCPKPDKEAFSQALRELGFMRPPQATSKTPSKKIAELEEKTVQIDRRREELENEIKELAKYRDDMKLVSDYFTARAVKYRAIGTLDHSKNTFIVKGYINEALADKLKSVIETDYTAVVEIEEATGEGVPVALKNNTFTAPAAGLTEMYALPDKDDIDPTPIMSFFYYLFFGMMLSDAGYGILLALGSWLIIKKCHPEKKMERSLRLFMYCGISTIIWGIVFGSFFGDAIWVIAQNFFGKTLPPWPFNPMTEAVKLFILSLAFGFLVVITGLCAKFYNSWRHGNKGEAIFETGSWIVLLLGIALVAVSVGLSVGILQTAGIVVALIGVVLVLGNGVRVKGPIGLITGIGGLYDITGYISDLMSFSRLMALGLTTAAMGQVFNLLGAMGGKSFFGALVFAVIFIAGHLISFALNALGSYVHTLRLQYVELFGKFYEGGGKPFKPFTHNSKYTRFKED